MSTAPIVTRPKRRFALAVVGVAGMLLGTWGCARVEVAPPPGQDVEVELLVVEGSDESTLAFVPVFIQGQGPFAFALDTGASNTVVDSALARRLNLQLEDSGVEVSGVFSRQGAKTVRIDNWRMGEVRLASTRAISFEMADEQINMQGLLGSDVLNRFGRVTIDYDQQRLYLRER